MSLVRGILLKTSFGEAVAKEVGAILEAVD
jgi:hypothetical protein